MSDPIAVGYPDEATASGLAPTLPKGVEKGLLDIADVVVIADGDDRQALPILGGCEVGFAAAGGATAGG